MLGVDQNKQFLLNPGIVHNLDLSSLDHFIGTSKRNLYHSLIMEWTAQGFLNSKSILLKVRA